MVRELVFWHVARTRGACGRYEPCVCRSSVEGYAKTDVPDFDDGIILSKQNDKELLARVLHAQNEQYALAIRRHRHRDDGRVHWRRVVAPVDDSGLNGLDPRTADMCRRRAYKYKPTQSAAAVHESENSKEEGDS